VAQWLGDERVSVHFRQAVLIGTVAETRDPLPALIAQPRPDRAVNAAYLRDRLLPGAHRRRFARVATNALEPERVNLGADIVKHDARDPLQLHDREHHRHETAHRSADDAGAIDTESREERLQVIEIHRDLVVVEVGIASRETAPANIGHHHAVARGDVRGKVLEIPTVAHHTVQTQHDRGGGAWPRVHTAEEPQPLRTVEPVFTCCHARPPYWILPLVLRQPHCAPGAIHWTLSSARVFAVQ